MLELEHQKLELTTHVNAGMEVLSSMCIRLTSKIRTLDEGAFTVSRIDSHITIAERLLRGLVILSGSLVAPHGIVDMMIRVLQTVISTLMIVSGNQIDRQCHGTVSYSPEIVPTWHGKEVGGDLEST